MRVCTVLIFFFFAISRDSQTQNLEGFVLRRGSKVFLSFFSGDENPLSDVSAGAGPCEGRR